MSVLCAICGSPHKVENAHVYPKKMGGRGSKAPADAHLTRPLCAGTGGNTDPRSCHGANEAGFIDLRPNDWSLTEAAPDKLCRRLKTKRGLRHPYMYLDVDPDAIDIPRDTPEEVEADAEFGAELHAMEQSFIEMLKAEGTLHRVKCERIAAARDFFTDHGRPFSEFEDWCKELADEEGTRMPVGKTQRHRALTIVDNLPEDIGRGLPPTKAYRLACAVRDRHGSVNELLFEVEASTAKAFAQAHGYEPEDEDKEVCPTCGRTMPKGAKE